MKRAVVSLLLLCLYALGFAHINPLENYDFTSGEYAFFLIAEPNFSADGINREGTGYSDDPATLQQIQRLWKLNYSPADDEEPATHYAYLHKNGQAIARFGIHLGSELLFVDRTPLKFTIQDYQTTRRLLTPFQIKTTQFQSREAALAHHQQLSENEAVIWHYTPDWVTYEGTFQFTYRCIDACKEDPLMNTANAKSVIDSLFHRKFPDAEFKMSSTSTSRTLISLSLLCHPDFASQLMGEPLTWSWMADSSDSPFEGSFWVGYKPNKNESLEDQVATASATFQTVYPDVPFELTYDGSHSKNSVVYSTLKIRTTHSILESFNLYPRGMAKFTPFDRFWMQSYWLGKSE